MKTDSGYTLIELLIVLGIIGIVGSFTFPSFANIIDNQKTGTLSHELISYLQLAKVEAITRNQAVTVCASVDEHRCSRKRDWSGQTIMIFADPDGDGQIDQGEPILKKKKLTRDNGSVIWRSFRNKSYLQWLPTGSTHYQNGNLTLCPASMNPRHGKTIITNAAGRMYFGSDRNQDGIPEGSDGRNIAC